MTIHIPLEILPLYIGLLAAAPFILLAYLYYYLSKKAGFTEKGKAKFYFVRFFFSELLLIVTILGTIFGLVVNYIGFMTLFVSLLIFWYLAERYVKKRYNLKDIDFWL